MSEAKSQPISTCPYRSISEMDPFDPAILSRPEAFWAALRKDAPIYEASLPGGNTRVFFVTRQADIEEIAIHPEKFSSRALPAIFRWPDQPPEFDAIFEGQKFASTFVTSDPPEHIEYRRVANAGLSPKQVKRWQPLVESIVAKLMDRFPISEPFDFVERYAVPLPSEVIRTILGLPEKDAEFLVWFTDEYMAMVDPSTPMDVALNKAAAVKKAKEYLLPIIAAYRVQPAENFFSTIANARRSSGELMSTEEVLSMVFIAIIGGNETTRNAISSTAMYLAMRPQIWETLKNDSSQIENFVNEAIRLAAPSNFLPRTALEDVEMHGVKIPKGATVFLFWGSGNRDETMFPNSEDIDLTRRNTGRSLTFGKGPHLCAGNHLARMEVRLTVERLLQCFSRIELAVPPESIQYEPIMAVRTLRSLPIRAVRSG